MNHETQANNEEYRRIIATSNKLETVQANPESVIYLFSPSIVGLHERLFNDSLALLFRHDSFKLEHFRRVEDVLWRRIYHDIYRYQKVHKQQLKKEDELLIGAHFISGIGFYSSLIIKLRYHYRISNSIGLVESLNLTLGPIDNFCKNSRLNQDDEFDCIRQQPTSLAGDWARNAIYRSLVYMGDLSRYLMDLNHPNYRKIAFNFYLSASRSLPDQGLPFNQLATLCGNTNHNLSAVCNYMRCSLKPKPFEGAEANMKKLFDIFIKAFNEQVRGVPVMKSNEVLSSRNPVETAETMMRHMIIAFITLTSHIWSALSIEGDNYDDINQLIANETRIFFEYLREALDLGPIVPLSEPNNSDLTLCPISGCYKNSERPKHVTSTIMFEFSSISMMMIAKYTAQHEATGKPLNCTLVDSINTLALNLLHYSMSKTQQITLNKLQEVKIMQKDLMERSSVMQTSSDLNFKGNASYSSGSSLDLIDMNRDLSSKRHLCRMHQKKAASNYQGFQSPLNDSDTISRDLASTQNQDDSDMSELEETAFSTIDALEISSGISDEVETNDDMVKSSSRGNISVDLCESVLSHIYNQSYLPTVKILCDWLLSDGNMINSNLQSFGLFCAELENLITFLEELRGLVMENSQPFSMIFKHCYDGPSWIQKYPMSCDFPLQNLAPFKFVHELNIDFQYQGQLNDAESGFLAIECTIAFCNALKGYLEVH